MELKEHQDEALRAFDRWREELDRAEGESAKRVAALESVGSEVTPTDRDYPALAWKVLSDSGGVAESAGPYVNRVDASGRPIPHVCLKIPTGGGKTLLAAAALERLNRPTGLTLWMIPTRAIYEQTKAALRNREHPYRQRLERASGGRVKLLEKDDSLTLYDVQNYMCVMLIMLQATNRRQNPDFLRMNRDSGDFLSFFPDSDNPLGQGELAAKYPSLRPESDGPIEQSLRNVIRMCRPVVILDEAHKAYRATADRVVGTVNGLDPSMVIELSATPDRRVSNLLVDVSGVQLHQAEMIKLPIRVTSETGAGWQHTLTTAHAKLDGLSEAGKSLQHAEGRYVRPIAVVRVERTGKDQRDSGHIHAEDVRDYLIQQRGVAPNEIAVKSSELDELRGVDLLSEYTPIRWIITKAALMEGWDCPFAYVLVMLDNTRSQRALTQLVGRVLRQPDTRRTGHAELDECHVICWSTPVGTAIEQVKHGLEQEGLTGLGDSVLAVSSGLKSVDVRMREQWRGKDIFLPKVLHTGISGEREELDYSRHILPTIDWSAIAAPAPQDSLPEPASQDNVAIYLDEIQGIRASKGQSHELAVPKQVSLAWFARGLTDIVPNAWQASRIAAEFLRSLRDAGATEVEIFDRRTRYAYALCEHVWNEVDKQSEAVFEAKLASSEISLDLEATKYNFRLREEYRLNLPDDYAGLMGNDGQQLRLNLFEPVYHQQFDSELERKFARYLDEQKALHWWHRVAVRQNGDYYVRGWRQDRIWPDFVALGGERDGPPHILVFETKGEHLKGNDDTEYKDKVLKALEEAFNSHANHGKLTVRDGPAKGTFRLVFNEADFEPALAKLKGAYKSSGP